MQLSFINSYIFLCFAYDGIGIGIEQEPADVAQYDTITIIAKPNL